MPYASPPPTTPSPQSTTSAAAVTNDSNLRSPGKRAKVPRPPNAFILYRKEHHPLLKAKDPDMHNNEISIILGKQWKSEPEQAKDKYRAHARIIKKLHAAENPGYQYAPRKPSEKKRRMTARKLVRVQAAAKEDGQSFPANGMNGITDQEQYESDDVIAVDESSEEDVILPSADPTPSAAGVLGVQCPPVRGDIAGPSYDGEMSVLMPTSRQDFGNLQQRFTNHLAPAQQYGYLFFDAYNRETMAADSAQHNMNDQDFLNSLINWDGIQADAELIHQMVADNRAELATAEMSGSSLLFADDAAAKFQAELDRVSKMM
jgi:ribosomal protein L20